MSDITDFSNFESEMNDFKSVVPRLKKEILALGGIIKDDFWPTEEELWEVKRGRPQNKLFEKYYGTSDILTCYEVMTGEKPESTLPEFAMESINRWRQARLRQQGENRMAETCHWGDNYDPVSKLVVCVMIAIEADNAAFNYSNEDARWIKHNYDYLKKIGFESQYHPAILKHVEKDYGRYAPLDISDEDIHILALSYVESQKSLVGVHCVPMDLAEVHDIALSRNNKSAESAPSFRNQKTKAVRDEVLADAEYVKANCDFHDQQLINEQRRIQSGGNILFDYVPLKLDEFGQMQITMNQIIEACVRIRQDRGDFTCYYEDMPKVLPELAGVIQISELPFAEADRALLIETEKAPNAILKKNKLTGEWLLNYKVSAPCVFTKVSDKYDNFDDIKDEIFTKHRSIKAAMGSFSRVGQSYLYPFMNEWKKKNMHYDNPYYSLVAQWSHPDDLKQMFTDMCVLIEPEYFKDSGVTTTISKDKVEKWSAFRSKYKLDTVMSSDDKTGFDMVNKWYLTWMFYCGFLSIPYDMTEQDKRLFKMFIVNDLICLMSGIDSLVEYSAIIESGQFNTSVRGTHSSNTESLFIRAKMSRNDDRYKTPDPVKRARDYHNRYREDD